MGEAEDLRDDEAVLVLHARRVLFQRGRLGPRGLQEQPADKGNGFRGISAFGGLKGRTEWTKASGRESERRIWDCAPINGVK